MKESSKASLRRLEEDKAGGASPISRADRIWWEDVFKGMVMDVGAGDDPLSREHWPNITTLVTFDHEDTYGPDVQGDANLIDDYFEAGQFDCIHCSQVLEHLPDPINAMLRMLKLIRPGGALVFTVPSELYERNILPSRYNGDHKATFSAISRDAPHLRTAPGQFRHIFIPDLKAYFPGHRIICKLVHSNYNFMTPNCDQSYDFNDMVEMWWEVIIIKPA